MQNTRLFESISSLESLFCAWEQFRNGKRHKKDVSAFEWNLESHIFALHEDLKCKQYAHGTYESFYINDPKQRHIHKASVRDRVVHHAVFQGLNTLFDPTFIEHSFSCRVKKGVHKGVKEVERMARKVSKNYSGQCYALKCDIQKFFDSIDHAILISILERKIMDEDTRWLLREIIGSFSSPRWPPRTAKGIPIGNLTSQLFANVYMNEFDQFIKHNLRVKYYARYTDDFLVLSDDRSYLENLLSPIEEFLGEHLSLTLHPKKVEITTLHRGIDFLGYVIRPHHKVLRSRTRLRMERKLLSYMRQYEQGKVSEEDIRAVLDSYVGIMSHADTHELSSNVKNRVLLNL